METSLVTVMVHMLPKYLDSQIQIPAVQREANVWTEDQRQLLIDSLYNNFDVPKIYVREAVADSETWILIDGQQRVTCISDFLNGRFRLGSGSTLPTAVRGKSFNDLKAKDQNRITSRMLHFVVIRCDEDEEEDMFLRLNNGTPLSAAEKRNAIKGKMRDFVAALARHKFFANSVNFTAKRFSHHAVCAQLVHLAMKGATDTKGPALAAMYREYRDSIPDQKTLESTVKGTLDWLSRIFPKKQPFMKKFSVTSYFLFLHELRRRYATKVLSDSRVRDFFIAFESDRAKNSELPPDSPSYDVRMGAYQTACVDGPDKADSIRTRHDYLLQRFLEANPGLEQLDRTRLFSDEMKSVIYFQSRRRCAGVSGFSCPKRGVELDFADAEFDHIKEHTVGGKTCVSNGQVLCRACHMHKTKSFNSKNK